MGDQGVCHVPSDPSDLGAHGSGRTTGQGEMTNAENSLTPTAWPVGATCVFTWGYLFLYFWSQVLRCKNMILGSQVWPQPLSAVPSGLL